MKHRPNRLPAEGTSPKGEDLDTNTRMVLEAICQAEEPTKLVLCRRQSETRNNATRLWFLCDRESGFQVNRQLSYGKYINNQQATAEMVLQTVTNKTLCRNQ